ncbi:MAG: glycosyltransferase family 39 protein [Nitrososphaeraceae archaeon]
MSFSIIKKNLFLRYEFILILLIFIIAFLIRVYSIGEVGFNNDEAIYSGQAASLAGFEEFQKDFSIFRAHPLLTQFFISLTFFIFGISETTARIIPVIFGSLTSVVVYYIGKLIYNQKLGFLASIIIALLPYHITITKQVLVDVPLSFFFSLVLLLLLLLDKKNNKFIVFLIGSFAGLSFISKEIGILTIPLSIISFIIIKQANLKNIVIFFSAFTLFSSPYWISFITIDEARTSLLSYMEWQSSRPPNHDLLYYFEILSKDILGYALSLLFLISLIYFIVKRKYSSKNLTLLSIWLFIPLIFYQILSIKGYHFLITLIPFFILFSISILNTSLLNKFRFKEIIIIMLIPIIIGSNNIFISEVILAQKYYPTLGSETAEEMKDTALWLRDNTTNNSTILTIYTHMANILKFYSHRDAISLQSNNNPAYDQIENADLLILSGKINYLVSEQKQVDNAKFLEKKSRVMNDYIIRYNGIPVYSTYDTDKHKDTEESLKAAITVYSINK